MNKSILFVTGTRADFGKMEPLAIAARDAGFNYYGESTELREFW